LLEIPASEENELNSTNERITNQGGSRIFVIRCLIAILQGVALYLLLNATDTPRTWPATDSLAFMPFVLSGGFAPVIIILGLGQIRIRPLLLWTLLATVAIAGLGLHAASRGTVPAYPTQAVIGPSLSLWLALGTNLFIAHALVVDAVIERRFAPSYPRHFDTAWKMAVQISLAFIFVGVFWGVLWLGATLFKLIDIDFFQTLIRRRWFWWPATTLAFAIAFHVTDVQPSLIRGARSLILTLFSWLLPLLVVILAGFLGSLPFISLMPLWKTRFATRLLLIAAGLLILLINASYEDGGAERTNSRIKRFAGSLGAIELFPVVGLAVWALSLRVAQYGWTTQRIFAAALTVIFSCYAVGYALAVVRSPSWLKRIEITNFATAYVVLGIFLALFSPLADPARLMVANQIARLRSGEVRPEKFDFVALKFDGARWGNAALSALKDLKDGPDALAISSRAAQVLAMTTRFAVNPLNPLNGTTKTSAEKAAMISIYPGGRTLPPDFFETSNESALIPANCFTNLQIKCFARYVTLREGGPESILFSSGIGPTLIFEQDASGTWQKAGTLSGPTFCNGFKQELQTDDIDMEPHPRPDLLIDGALYPSAAATALQTHAKIVRDETGRCFSAFRIVNRRRLILRRGAKRPG
jgi:hypothetical protein